jgi:hypothetical protein
MKDIIGESLGLDDESEPETGNTELQVIDVDESDDTASEDFDAARVNIHKVIMDGQSAIDTLTQIAESSQHPRAYEVLATLMNTMLHANKDLMTLQEKKSNITGIERSPSAGKTINNNLFVGSTSELQKVLKGINEDNEPDN